MKELATNKKWLYVVISTDILVFKEMENKGVMWSTNVDKEYAVLVLRDPTDTKLGGKIVESQQFILAIVSIDLLKAALAKLTNRLDITLDCDTIETVVKCLRPDRPLLIAYE